MTAPKTTEASIQATLKHALEACGYIVGEVGKARSAKAAGCYIGNTNGLPDLFITHPQWPVGEWLGLELKTPTGKVRPEQQRLADAGRVVIVRGVYEGLDAVVEFDVANGRDLIKDGERRRKLAGLTQQFQEVK
jgi:hypothetical protein